MPEIISTGICRLYNSNCYKERKFQFYIQLKLLIGIQEDQNQKYIKENMKKILITRKLINSSEDKASNSFLMRN